MFSHITPQDNLKRSFGIYHHTVNGEYPGRWNGLKNGLRAIILLNILQMLSF